MPAVQIPCLEGGSIGSKIESCVNWDGVIAMVPCLHQGNIYAKRKLRVCRVQNCIALVGAITPLTSAGHESIPSTGRHYRVQNGKVGKLGQTNHHGTVFVLRQNLYQKEATGME